MNKAFTIFFLLTVCNLSFAQFFQINTDCEEEKTILNNQLVSIEIKGDPGIIKARLIKHEDQTSEYTYHLPVNKKVPLERNSLYSVMVSACDSISQADTTFLIIDSDDEIIYLNDFVVVEYLVDTTYRYYLASYKIETEIYKGIYPNPTTNITSTISNMKNMGYLPVVFFTELGQHVNIEQLKNNYSGVIFCQYSYIDHANNYKYDTVRIVID